MRRRRVFLTILKFTDLVCNKSIKAMTKYTNYQQGIIMIEFMMMFTGIAGLIAILAWLEQKLNVSSQHFSFTDCWASLSGMPVHTTTTADPDKDQIINDLQQRVATLEAIVTNNAYQLDEKLRNL